MAEKVSYGTQLYWDSLSSEDWAAITAEQWTTLCANEAVCGCCPSSAIVAINDYGIGVGGARPFLQRIGALNAMSPGSRFSPGASRVHTIPLKKPLPLPELQTMLLGELPPDKGKSLDWPYPDYEQEE